MPISRRQFFRRFLGPEDRAEKERRERVEAVESFLRNNLLPYDYTLNPGQTEELFAAITSGVAVLTEEELVSYSPQVRELMNRLNTSMVDIWRESHYVAEEVRKAAALHIAEFLAVEVTPENLQQLRHRFNIPYPTLVEEEVQRQAQLWLNGLSDAKLAEYSTESVRDLVFSELRGWC